MRYEHQIGIFSGILGDFRKDDVEVTHSTFTPVKAIFIPDAMRLLINWINEKLMDQDYDKIKLPATKKGKLWYVKVRDVERYVESQAE